MNRNRLAAVVAGGAFLLAMTACTERTRENMIPTGEVVEVDVPVPDTIPHPATQMPEMEDYTLSDDVQ